MKKIFLIIQVIIFSTNLSFANEKITEIIEGDKNAKLNLIV